MILVHAWFMVQNKNDRTDKEKKIVDHIYFNPYKQNILHSFFHAQYTVLHSNEYRVCVFGSIFISRCLRFSLNPFEEENKNNKTIIFFGSCVVAVKLCAHRMYLQLSTCWNIFQLLPIIFYCLGQFHLFFWLNWKQSLYFYGSFPFLPKLELKHIVYVYICANR